ncbi:unnamed protein product [Periconia digitata]|uniref:Uncharacterized protein n=1 Tax=Periconia digitata TaxID=1303443 RepID=A0A9W4XZ34_9PLEO|nr:unnamed protein product [Periconia digitata]
MSKIFDCVSLASSSKSYASMYESGTSDAGSSDFTSDPRAGFFGVGNPHGESSPPWRSSANRLLPVGFGSSSKSEELCLGFGREGRSSSPKRDMTRGSEWRVGFGLVFVGLYQSMEALQSRRVQSDQMGRSQRR